MLRLIEYCSLSTGEVDRRADEIPIVPLQRKRVLTGIIPDIHRQSRIDMARGITEATQNYIVQRVEEELRGRAPNATQDIIDLKDTVKHLTTIIEKNTAIRILEKTNEQDKIDSEEDEPILGSIVPSPSPYGKDVFGTWKLYGTRPDGDEWASFAWANGIVNNRFLDHTDVDPFDSQFSYENFTGTVQLQIDGINHVRQSTLDPTIKLKVLSLTTGWKNTETTIWVKREPGDPGTDFKMTIKNRSNIFKTYSGETPNNCGFGNYDITWRHADAKVAIGVEPLAPIREDSIKEKIWHIGEFPENIWVGLKAVARDNLVDNTVNLEGWSCDLIGTRQDPVCWHKDVEFKFTGANVDVDPTGNETRVTDCTNKGSLTANDLDGLGTNFLNRTGLHTWIQAQNFTKVRFKWMTVREITNIIGEECPQLPGITI